MGRLTSEQQYRCCVFVVTIIILMLVAGLAVCGVTVAAQLMAMGYHYVSYVAFGFAFCALVGFVYLAKKYFSKVSFCGPRELEGAESA